MKQHNLACMRRGFFSFTLKVKIYGPLVPLSIRFARKLVEHLGTLVFFLHVHIGRVSDILIRKTLFRFLTPFEMQKVSF